MSRVLSAQKLTDSRFLNLYEMQVEQRGGKQSIYHVASRAKDATKLKAISGENKPDAVAICAFVGAEAPEKLVLIRQYRFPVGGYIYELPAGLVENGESVLTTAIREMFEETGMEFIPNGDANVNRPFFSSPGMTDESISLVMGRCTGTPTNENQEDSEDIQVVLADKAECLRILSEEAVDVRVAYMIMLFLSWN